MNHIRILSAGFSLLALMGVVFFSPARSHAIPVIQEVLYDGPGTDADDVFTEIFGIAGMNLDGWSLVGVNGSDQHSYRTVTLEGAMIPNDGILVITTFSATADLLAHSDFFGEVDWQNGPDAVQLRDSQGNIIDALQYGDAGVNNAGEGRPAVDVASGWSLSRDVFSTDTNDNLADFTPTSSPTPGTRPMPVPEPGALLLLTMTILSLIAYVGKTFQVQ